MKSDSRTKYHIIACALIVLIYLFRWTTHPGLGDTVVLAGLAAIVVAVVVSVFWELGVWAIKGTRGDLMDVIWGLISATITAILFCIVYTLISFI